MRIRNLDHVYDVLFFLFLMSGDLLSDFGILTTSSVTGALFAVSGVSLYQTKRPGDNPKKAFLFGLACGLGIFLLLDNGLLIPSVWVYGFGEILQLFLVSLTCYRKNHTHLLRIVALALLTHLVISNACALGGAATISEVYLERGVIRSGLGNGHPNVFSMYLLTFAVVVYLANCFHTVWFNLLLPAGVCLVCALFTHTRTAMLFCAILMVCQLTEWFFHRNATFSRLFTPVLRLTDLVAIAAFPLNCLLWFSLIALYPRNYPLVGTINSVMANRIRLASDAIRESGVSAFGTSYSGDTWLWTDNGYSMLLMNYGVVFLVLLGILWICISVRFLRAGHRRLLYTFAFVALWGGEGTVLASFPPNVFFFLATADLSASAAPFDEIYRKKKNPVSLAVPAFLTLCLICLLPVLFSHMRTITALDPVLKRAPAYELYRRTSISFVIVVLMIRGVTVFAKAFLDRRRVARREIVVFAICTGLVLMHVLSALFLTRMHRPEADKLIEADTPAVETILAAKTGDFYVDPFPELYRQRFKGIKRSFLYGRDLARVKNATVLTDNTLDGSNTFSTQGFQFAEISDDHAVYTNDAPVIAALQQKGYTVTPYYSHIQHVDLEETAEKTEHLTYDPYIQGIYVDQISHMSPQIWNTDTILYTGEYQVTFTCHILYHEENDPDAHCKLAVNYGFSDEITSVTLTASEADENGCITKTFPFTVYSRERGSHVVFSVYGGDIRRMFVDDISYVRLN